MARLRTIIAAVTIFVAAAMLFHPVRSLAQQEDPFSLDVIDITEDQDFLDKVAKENKKAKKAETFSLENLPEEIPRDHWVYTALEYLQKQGLIDDSVTWNRLHTGQVSDKSMANLLDTILENYDILVSQGILKPREPQKANPPRLVEIPQPAKRAVPSATIDPDMPRTIQKKSLLLAPVTSAEGKSVPLASSPPVGYMPPVNAVKKPIVTGQGFDPLNLPIPPEPQIPLVLPGAYPESKNLKHGGMNNIGGGTAAPAETSTPATAESAPATAQTTTAAKTTETETETKTEAAPEEAVASADTGSSRSSSSSRGPSSRGSSSSSSRGSSSSTRSSSSSSSGKSSSDTKSDKEEKKKKVKVPKEFSKLEKKVDLTEKDVEILEAVIDYVEKDVVKGDIAKDISDIKRTAQTNERDIEKLEEQNQRIKITGSGTASYSRTTKSYKTVSYDPEDDGRDAPTVFPGEPSGGVGKSLSANFYSKPRRFDDMTMRWSGSLTSSSDMRIEYRDFTTDKDNPRNFKLRSFYGGRISFGASPLTTLGRSMDGFFSELKLNDYSIKGAIGTHSSDGNIFINAASAQFNLFGEPSSWAYITRISSYNKRNSKYDEDYDSNDRRRWGWWSGGDDSVYLPPEKNSVTSLYIRYPMPIEGLFMTAEYAHSTYYRPGFKLAFTKDGSYDDYDEDCDDGDCGSWDEYWADTSATFSPENEFVNWMAVPEMAYQDDAFFLLFDYNKGPLQIFPMGYARLGNTFVSKYLGLPGFSVDDFGLDLLPINLQSLHLAILMGSYKKLEDNYKWDFLAVAGGETDPMFLDVSAGGNTLNSVDILTKFFARINNRPQTAKLKLSYIQNKFTYYLTDDITFSGEFATIKALLPESCIDANITETTDDYGNTVDKFIGNGVAICSGANKDPEDVSIKIKYAQKTQKYNLFWRTSKKSELSFDYNIDAVNVLLHSSIEAANSLLLEELPKGRNYYMKFNYKYRLTDVSRVEMWYNKDFPREQFMDSEIGTTFQQTIGLKLSMSY